MKINKGLLKEAMERQGIPSIEDLVVAMRHYNPRVSYPTVMRWNAEGWPEYAVNLLCDILRVKPEEIFQ